MFRSSSVTRSIYHDPQCWRRGWYFLLPGEALSVWVENANRRGASRLLIGENQITIEDGEYAGTQFTFDFDRLRSKIPGLDLSITEVTRPESPRAQMWELVSGLESVTVARHRVTGTVSFGAHRWLLSNAVGTNWRSAFLKSYETCKAASFLTPYSNDDSRSIDPRPREPSHHLLVTPFGIPTEDAFWDYVRWVAYSLHRVLTPRDVGTLYLAEYSGDAATRLASLILLRPLDQQIKPHVAHSWAVPPSCIFASAMELAFEYRLASQVTEVRQTIAAVLWDSSGNSLYPITWDAQHEPSSWPLWSQADLNSWASLVKKSYLKGV